MRILLGLDSATSGHAWIEGSEYASLRDPLMRVGALLGARGARRGRSAFHHLRVLALTRGISSARVDEVLEKVELEDAAHHCIGTFRSPCGSGRALLASFSVTFVRYS